MTSTGARPPGGESATPVASNVTATSYTDTGVANGTTYYYTVAAVNSAGVSAPSAEASATPQPTVPSAPLAVTAAGANASVSLAWSAPASNGGAAITGYDVYRGTTAGRRVEPRRWPATSPRPATPTPA